MKYMVIFSCKGVEILEKKPISPPKVNWYSNQGLGQLKTKIFICDQFWGILWCFDKYREPFSVGAQNGSLVANVRSKAQ